MQAERSSVPLLLGGRSSWCILLSWQREDNFVISSGEAMVNFGLVLKRVISISLRRSERMLLDGGGEG
jgi:hypothetical protein